MKQNIARILTVFILSIFVCTSSKAVTPYHEVDLGYGKWSKSWFADDFGDPMYDKPYIQTELKTILDKYSWRFFYILYTFMPNIGDIFLMNIGADGNNIYVEGQDAIVKIKDTNGNVSTLTAGVTNGRIAFADADMLAFGNLINSGNYTLAVTFHSYLDFGGKPVTWTFKCTNETRGFWKAAESIY